MSKNYNCMLDHNALSNICMDLMSNHFKMLGTDLADNILLIELKYLYINKVCEYNPALAEAMEIFIMDIDNIIMRYYHLMSYDFNNAIHSLVSNHHMFENSNHAQQI